MTDTLTTPDDDFVDEPEAPKQMTLPELRKYEGQLFIQNNTANKITFHERMGDKWVDFELDPAGEPDSVAFLPKLALDMRGLQKLWMKGTIKISSDPEMEDAIMLLNAQAVGVSEQRMKTMLGQQTEANTNANLIEKECLVKGCAYRNPQTNVIERGRVIQSRRQDKDGIPPLCSNHLDQASFFVPRLVQDKGEQHWEFDSMQIGTTQR